MYTQEIISENRNGKVTKVVSDDYSVIDSFEMITNLFIDNGYEMYDFNKAKTGSLYACMENEAGVMIEIRVSDHTKRGIDADDVVPFKETRFGAQINIIDFFTGREAFGDAEFFLGI